MLTDNTQMALLGLLEQNLCFICSTVKHCKTAVTCSAHECLLAYLGEFQGQEVSRCRSCEVGPTIYTIEVPCQL